MCDLYLTRHSHDKYVCDRADDNFRFDSENTILRKQILLRIIVWCLIEKEPPLDDLLVCYLWLAFVTEMDWDWRRDK